MIDPERPHRIEVGPGPAFFGWRVEGPLLDGPIYGAFGTSGFGSAALSWRASGVAVLRVTGGERACPAELAVEVASGEGGVR